MLESSKKKGTIMDELDALKAIDDTLSKIQDSDTKNRILKWAFDKYGTEQIPSSAPEIPMEKKKVKKIKKIKKAKRKSTKTTLTIVKDLNLKPSGKKSLVDFVKEKNPSSDREKCIVSIYYLYHELKNNSIDPNSVYTCFKHMSWRVPANIDNVMRWLASQRGWLDTSNMKDVKITTHGDNFVEHDLVNKE